MEPVLDPLEFLQQEVANTRQLLLNNGLYYRLQTMADLRQLMEHQVFAVWDFMSLLKALQRHLTCVAVPWVPTANPATRRLVNEIVLEEETGLDSQGQPTSHFELYVRAMDECGADTQPIRQIVAGVAAGRSVTQALADAQVPESVRQFVETTFRIIQSDNAHEMAAAFTFGREQLVPAVFGQLVDDLCKQFPAQLDTFAYYLDRHTKFEAQMHAPLARQMVRELCADDPECWQQAQQVTIECLEARMVLWDGIQPTQASLSPV